MYCFYLRLRRPPRSSRTDTLLSLHDALPIAAVRLSIEREETRGLVSAAGVRSHIEPQTVAYHPEGNLAYIRLSGFNKRTADGLRQKIAQAQNELGSDLRGYILDLRGNPGGLLEQAIAVRSEEHTAELQSLMRISSAVSCLKKNNKTTNRKL